MPGSHVKSPFKTVKPHNTLTNRQIVTIFSSKMNKLFYIYVPNEFVIGQVVLKSFIKRLAIAMVNKTVENIIHTL
jgi:hypothetical protein